MVTIVRDAPTFTPARPRPLPGCPSCRAPASQTVMVAPYGEGTALYKCFACKVVYGAPWRPATKYSTASNP